VYTVTLLVPKEKISTINKNLQKGVCKMATHQKDKSESLEIFGVMSKSVGALVGAATASGKKIAGLCRGRAAKTHLKARVDALESNLAAVRRELKKISIKKKDVKSEKKQRGKGTKTKKKVKKARVRATAKIAREPNVTSKSQELHRPVAKAKISSDKSRKMAHPSDSES
jgi:cysteinyl-tRNA synthetase